MNGDEDVAEVPKGIDGQSQAAFEDERCAYAAGACERIAFRFRGFVFNYVDKRRRFADGNYVVAGTSRRFAGNARRCCRHRTKIEDGLRMHDGKLPPGGSTIGGLSLTPSGP